MLCYAQATKEYHVGRRTKPNARLPGLFWWGQTNWSGVYMLHTTGFLKFQKVSFGVYEFCDMHICNSLTLDHECMNVGESCPMQQIPDVYSVAARLEIRPEHRQSWIKFFVVFSLPARKCCNSNTNCTTTASFNILSHSLFSIILFFNVI